MNTYKTPILANVFYAFATLSGIGSSFVALAYVPSVAAPLIFLGGCINALLFAGAGQVIDLIGKTAFHAERMANSVAGNPPTEIETPQQPVCDEPEPTYFVWQNGKPDGPHTSSTLKDLHDSERIEPGALISPNGRDGWQPFRAQMFAQPGE